MMPHLPGLGRPEIEIGDIDYQLITVTFEQDPDFAGFRSNKPLLCGRA